MGSLEEKNNRIIQDAINRLLTENKELRERLTMAENNIGNLHAEINNAKALFAHVAARGMGSTVHK
jgi:hypothetical protein